MIEIEIPKDVRDYETKLLGPFTTRQLICAVCMALLCFLTYKGTSALLSEESSLKIFFPIVVAIPFGLIGWIKPYGMKFERFAKSVFVSMFLSPTKRYYKINNVHDRFDKIIDDEEKAKLAKENAQKKSNSKKAQPN